MAGLTLTGWWIWHIQRQQWAMVLTTFRFHAEERGHLIGDRLEGLRQDLESLVRFYECSEVVEPDEFHLFVAPILARSEIRFVVWRPFREGSSSELRADGADDYCEPLAWRERVDDFDLFYATAVQEALIQSRTRGMPVASAPVTNFFNGGEMALFLCAIVRSGLGPAKASDRHPPQRGALVAAFGWSGFLKSALQPFHQPGLWVQLKDVTDPLRPVVVAESGDSRQVRKEACWSRVLPWANRHYRLEIGMTPAFLSARSEWAALWIWTLGPLLSSFLAIYLASVLAARRRAEELTAIRTRELRTREEELRQSVECSRLLLTAFELAEESIAILDCSGMIVQTNAAFGRLTGFAHAEAVGRDYWELLAPGTPEGKTIREAIRKALRQGHAWRGVLPSRRRDGTLFQEAGLFLPVKGDHPKGGPCVVVVSSDATGLRDEEERKQQVQRLESIGFLAGGIAHDLNNLLQPILGYAELIEMDSTLPRAVRSDVDAIREAAQKARELVQQLMAFARKQRLQMIPLDLSDALGRFIPFLRRTLKENIRIEFRGPPRLHRILADRVQIEQVLLNLAINAQEAMPEGGTLTIETAEMTVTTAVPDLPVPVPPGRYVRLTVRDTGVGMDEETKRRAFEPFFTTKGRTHRTGMGLATVYGIVRQHGGHIGIRSAPGQGAEFSLFFPVLEAEAPAGLAASHEGSVEAVRVPAPHKFENRRTVLLAEDEEAVRKLVQSMLVRLGYEVLTASSSAEVLALARQRDQPIDLLLTDIIMPGLSGLDLYRRLTAERPGLRVIFMSGYADAAKVERQGWPTHVPYLQKPFDLATLEAALARVFSAEPPSGHP